MSVGSVSPTSAAPDIAVADLEVEQLSLDELLLEEGEADIGRGLLTDEEFRVLYTLAGLREVQR